MTPPLRAIALIDDNDADNFFHGMLLERSGITGRVDVFESAERALAWFVASPDHDIDLILLDINMPRMDGFEFLDAFHLLPADSIRGTRIYMLSSSPMDADRNRAMAYARVDGFIVKPLDEAAIRALSMHIAVPDNGEAAER
ncbi:response regulator [Methyloversatilis thermotolerans]|uniref:response regulator n=1 Tax=Methyloversatilis thermotolerans TaxID=1346290 RepID=UPI00035C78C3|nr:response regulator [Methyloversatilis thermotolerans]